MSNQFSSLKTSAELDKTKIKLSMKMKLYTLIHLWSPEVALPGVSKYIPTETVSPKEITSVYSSKCSKAFLIPKLKNMNIELKW